MALVVFPKLYTEPPPKAAQIDWSHPLSHGLNRAWLFTGDMRRKCRDHIRGDVLTQSRDQSDTTYQANSLGACYHSGADGGGSYGMTSAIGEPLGAVGITIAASLRGHGGNWALSTLNGILGTGDPSAGTTGADIIRLCYSSAAGVTFAFTNQTSYEVGATAIVSSFGQDKHLTLAASFQRTGAATYGGVFQFIANWLWSGTNNHNPVGSYGGSLTAASYYIVGALDKNSTGNSSPDQQYQWLYVWLRGLVPTELLDAVTYPYRIFKPQKQAGAWKAAAGASAFPHYYYQQMRAA